MTAIDLPSLTRFADLLGPKGFTTDPDAMAPWLKDWRGRYEGAAAALLSPADADQVAAVVRLAGALGIALVPQGGNTSMVGGATPPATGNAMILSLRRMNAIRSIAAEDGVVVAEAGVILAHLHDAVLEHGMRFPLTLGGKGSATVGGLVSTNAGGTQVLRFGTMRALTLGIEAVLPDGSRFDGLSPLKKDNRGYDLKHLLIGAEGTLGIITAASLKLVPAILDRAVGWIGVETPHQALALLRFMEARAADAQEGFEIVPADSLALVLKHIPGTRAPLQGTHPWHVLVEMVRSDARAEASGAVLEQILGDALTAGLCRDATIAASEAQAEAFWKLRDSLSEAERASGPAVQHDISVPVSGMPDFMISAARDVEARFVGTRASAFGHLGDGNVHFHVRAPEDAALDWAKTAGKAVSAYVHDLVVAAGGSISAEHGIGQMKLEENARLSDPARLMALSAIKAAFDPKGLMNPGKLVLPGGLAQESLATRAPAP
ncbi:FAD-binding oxidoreductase [Sphingobium boeckii]|uniref:FAD/FMN-containing dehydrogenase n=1 Tax=Sphingobium boeckii TaxID=1082345 RepID=A0A7W9EE92_9SPHN|nr:FAD-binding oxidoreductase [Sphingobium boeckii]MBB5685774.1 FAD/FMN-containing dehydrogenase [Sphingobium boeckii]